MKQMNWSIYKDSALPYEQWQECHTAWFVDLDSDTNYYPNKIKFLHDGVHPVYYGKNATFVSVVDGKFDDIELVKARIGELVELDGYHGTFIEGFRRIDGKLQVAIGS